MLELMDNTRFSITAYRLNKILSSRGSRSSKKTKRHLSSTNRGLIIITVNPRLQFLVVSQRVADRKTKKTNEIITVYIYILYTINILCIIF